MVTGVETAGLVLGSLPLLISALENYDDIVGPTKQFFSWKKHKRKLIQELYTLRASYDQAIQVLLEPITESEDLIIMMHDPDSDLWKTGSIADDLRNTLKSTYDPLISTIGDIAEILRLIAAHLHLEGLQQGTAQLRNIIVANQPIPNSRNQFQFAKRLKFTMKKRSIKISLERLEQCTGRIGMWVERARKYQGEPAMCHSRLNFTESLDSIQRNASRIHNALSENWCRRKPRHSTYLLLEQRLKRSRPKRGGHHASVFGTISESSCFKLSISGDCCPPSQQLNTEFRVAEILPRFDQIRITVSDAQANVQDPPYTKPSTLPQVKEICQHLEQPAQVSVGFCVDDVGSLRLYSSESPATQYVDQSATLETILPELQENVSLEELYCLAITLVASVFQLSHTPWLQREWTKKDIAFLRASSNAPLNVDIKYPYLARDFFQMISRPCKQSSKTTSVDGSKFLALAIILLEIRFGKPIEQVRRLEDQGKKSTSGGKVDLPAAEWWYKAERSRLSFGFSKAILTALQESLNPDADLNDPEYCTVVKEKMLQPLEDEMQCMLFGPPRR
ncbi:hypothetical protein DM02DRAFT_603527 [Periconia macrospinosa]|uniref:DUF7580 domain-containing protein n=1 Tax=Periconia macrospinosa TaxID=97972 RepID=A0A2V1D980_9PLEO|nr:hypothetical protein DM02DRAFT_603527 [Periconia macrospinosa]